MQLLHVESKQHLIGYVQSQLRNFFPFGEDPLSGLIECYVDEALFRLERCIADVKWWRPGIFDVLHSSQYCIFLYYLSNTIWRRERASVLCTKLFLLNKALNGIDCFYEIELPEVFFIGHSVGVVLAKATYGECLVLYQNSTVGKNHGVAPVLEKGVILYPNSAVIGRCLVRENTAIAQGVGVVNADTNGHSMVFSDMRGGIVHKPFKHNILGDFFRSQA